MTDQCTIPSPANDWSGAARSHAHDPETSIVDPERHLDASVPAELTGLLQAAIARCRESYESSGRDNPTEALDAVRAAFLAARHLRLHLETVLDDLGASAAMNIAADVDRALGSMLGAADRIHGRYGREYVDEVRMQTAAAAGAGSRTPAVRRHALHVVGPDHAEPDAAPRSVGVQTIRECLAPLNELHIVIAMLAENARNGRLDDNPF